MPNGSPIDIEKAIYAPEASRNLLSFCDLRKNGLHVATATSRDGCECLQIVNNNGQIVEKCADNGNGLYFTHIKPHTECDATLCAEDTNQPKVPNANVSALSLWHDLLGHPGRNMLKKMAKSVQSISLSLEDIEQHGTRIRRPCAVRLERGNKIPCQS